MNNFLVALVLYIYDRFEIESKTERMITKARWGTFVCALALTNQHTTLFLVAPIALRVLWKLRNVMTLNLFLQLFCCGLLGLSPYLYLPITTSFQVKDGWGDMTTMRGFLKHFLRQEYVFVSLYNNFTHSNRTHLNDIKVRNLPTHGRWSR